MSRRDTIMGIERRRAGLRPGPRQEGFAPWTPTKGDGPWNRNIGAFMDTPPHGPIPVRVGAYP